MTLADSKIADIDVAVADGWEGFVGNCITTFRHFGDSLKRKVAIALC